jgi:hypothetical protein
MPSAETGAAGVPDSPDPGISGTSSMKSPRQVFDIAHPVHPTAGAAVQKDKGRPLAPQAPDHLGRAVEGRAAGARAIERGDEFGRCWL